LLIAKQKPLQHQGEFEVGEAGLICLSREVKEESALEIPASQWQETGNLSWEDWRVEIFASILSGGKRTTRSLTSDPVA